MIMVAAISVKMLNRQLGKGYFYYGIRSIHQFTGRRKEQKGDCSIKNDKH